ncbi:MAG TPA: (Fe-S)-binding protein [Syntrophobacteria bacterium]|nr:(Fe-S)-binding protein [Syntrophobacteria bacterium]
MRVAVHALREGISEIPVTPMIHADLYLQRIDFRRYLPGSDCGECGASSCVGLIRGLKEGTLSPADCPFLPEQRIAAFRLALRANEILPAVPAFELPRPGCPGLVEINNPLGDAPVLVSGNSQFTQEVVTTLLGFTMSPFQVLFVDCRGDTVDMAVIYQSLTVERICRALAEAQGPGSGKVMELILPGLARELKRPLAEQTGWSVQVGPVCIAELPLFFGERWRMAEGW